jgi:glycosyltransferase involved in cell wall biosynthesis
MATFPSPSETFALREIRAMTQRGWDVTVFAARRPAGTASGMPWPRTIYRPRLLSGASVSSLIYLIAHYPLALWRLALLMAAVLKECPRDFMVLLANIHTVSGFVCQMDRSGIDHVHGYFLSWPACIAMAIAKTTKRTMSLSTHARDIFVEAGAVRAKVELSTFVASCTEQGLTQLREWVPPGQHHKLHLVRHGIEPSLVSHGVGGESHLEQHGSSRGERILFVGRLVPKKGLEYLIEAFAAVHAKRPSCVLTIIGDGPGGGEINRRVDLLGLGDCVELCGWRDSATVADYMRRSLLLAVPSIIDPEGDRDGVPNVVLEAFACGAVVVASRLDGIAEAVKNGETGVLVEPGDAGQLADAVLRLFEDVETRGRLASQARDFVARHYDPQRNIEHLTALFDQAVA